MIKVAKFGGTSLADANQFKKVYDIIKHDTLIKYVIASAPGSINNKNNKITDLLYLCYENKKNNTSYKEIFAQISEIFNNIVDTLKIDIKIQNELEQILLELQDGCSKDYFVSRGEYLNSIILSKYLDFKYIDAKDIIFFDDNGVLDANKTNTQICNALKGIENVVVPGFYGSMFNGRIKTFTRGGSDITGAIVAKAVNADVYENWTDVSGFLMADPRIIKKPKKIEVITYRELRELAYMGATVLHDEAVFPARQSNIPINIRNTNFPLDCGTLIVDQINDKEDPKIITGIAGKKEYTIFSICKENMAASVGIIKRALEVFEARKIIIEHVPTGIDKFSVVVASKNVNQIENQISDELKLRCKAENIEVSNNIALIASVGRHIKNKSSIFKRLFGALEKENIDIKLISQGLSEINVIIGVDNKNFEKSITAIYNEFV
ncbi:aspartate kinase [Sedimentibacter sp. zth1]|uniref:aspartate kinase n=1 Tax=Sedimentibacter sp. zth1 TaxID=2816908 RepID=UPI0035302329